jgi:acetate kinase
MKKEQTILCLNSGSSSLKFSLYQMGNNEERLLAKGELERIGLKDGFLRIRSGNGRSLSDIREDFPDHTSAVEAAFTFLKEHDFPEPQAAGHRVVHGGQDFVSPAIVDTGMLDILKGLVPYAPLHLPAEIQGITAVSARFPDLPQVACFDTAFHRKIPEISQRLPLPRHLFDRGLKRYGFHGISYEYISSRLGPSPPDRVIIAHLGNGVSLAALYRKKPVDTTMGFTPAGGCMMGTRSGDMDPGALLYLLREKGYDVPRLEHLVNNESGLLGVSGISPDMKTLLDRRKSLPHAAQAVDMFCRSVRKHIGALSGVLGGLDMLVFTGGIGERAAEVRSEICGKLEYLGILLDRKNNMMNAEIISVPEGPCTVRVIPTKEDLMIARHTHALLFPE